MENNVNVIKNFSAKDEKAKIIVDTLADLGRASASKEAKYKTNGLFGEVLTMSAQEYREKNEDTKMALIAFSAVASGLDSIVDYTTKDGLVRCFSNTSFKEIYNSIVVEAIGSIILNANPTALMALCNIVDVEVGESYTATIECKGLPVAQRTSYGSGVTFLDSYSMQGITIAPKPWTLGAQIDYIRILDRTFDFGREIARVAMGLLYAQYRLVAGILFDTAKLNNTPFYAPAFTDAKEVEIISYLQATNGGAEVKAYGTIPAFNKAGAISTKNFGFESQDEMLRNGFLGRANGIENIGLTQATDLAIPFTTDNMSKNLLLPNDKILLVSSVGSKPVTLVRENFVFVKETTGNEGSLRRLTYAYTQSFEASLATQANYAIMNIA